MRKIINNILLLVTVLLLVMSAGRLQAAEVPSSGLFFTYGVVQDFLDDQEARYEEMLDEQAEYYQQKLEEEWDEGWDWGYDSGHEVGYGKGVANTDSMEEAEAKVFADFVDFCHKDSEMELPTGTLACFVY